MRFASLGSGSCGNGTLIEHGSTCLMVDCGFSLSETERRLSRLGKHGDQLAAVLVTHEHTDHIGGIVALARKYSLTVWLTPGTWSQRRFGDFSDYKLIDRGERFVIGDLEVHPFSVPHDAREPAQFVFHDGVHSVALLTDVGCSTQEIEHALADCTALLLECNHERAMLANGPYTTSLKQRVGGDVGHLSNTQAAQLLSRIAHPRLQHVVAMHLSQTNNTPRFAQSALSDALGCVPDEIAVASQTAGLSWRELTR